MRLVEGLSRTSRKALSACTLPSVVRLLRVCHQEKALLREWQRAHPADPAPAEAGRMDARVTAAQMS